MATSANRNFEAVSKDTTTRKEYSFYRDETPLHVSRIEHKNKPVIQVFPYSYSEAKGVTPTLPCSSSVRAA